MGSSHLVSILFDTPPSFVILGVLFVEAFPDSYHRMLQLCAPLPDPWNRPFPWSPVPFLEDGGQS